MKKLQEHPVLTSTILGILAGFLGVIGYKQGTFFPPVIMLLIPGIIFLCYKRIIAGFGIGLFLIQIIWLITWLIVDTTINGRLILPLTVHIAPGVSICTPYYGNEMSWQSSTITSFGLFLFFANSTYLLLMHPLFKLKLKTYFFAISASVIVVCGLYPLSWGAKLSGTFRKPLSSPTEEFISLFIFMLLFPVNMFILSSIANKMNKNANKEAALHTDTAPRKSGK